jgi:hypothetical protein
MDQIVDLVKTTPGYHLALLGPGIQVVRIAERCCLLFVHDDLEPLKVIGPYLLGHFLFLFTGVVI